MTSTSKPKSFPIFLVPSAVHIEVNNFGTFVIGFLGFMKAYFGPRSSTFSGVIGPSFNFFATSIEILQSSLASPFCLCSRQVPRNNSSTRLSIPYLNENNYNYLFGLISNTSLRSLPFMKKVIMILIIPSKL